MNALQERLNEPSAPALRTPVPTIGWLTMIVLAAICCSTTAVMPTWMKSRVYCSDAGQRSPMTRVSLDLVNLDAQPRAERGLTQAVSRIVSSKIRFLVNLSPLTRACFCSTLPRFVQVDLGGPYTPQNRRLLTVTHCLACQSDSETIKRFTSI